MLSRKGRTSRVGLIRSDRTSSVAATSRINSWVRSTLVTDWLISRTRDLWCNSCALNVDCHMLVRIEESTSTPIATTSQNSIHTLRLKMVKSAPPMSHYCFQEFMAYDVSIDTILKQEELSA